MLADFQFFCNGGFFAKNKINMHRTSMRTSLHEILHANKFSGFLKNFFDVRPRRTNLESAHRENYRRRNYDSHERACRLETFCSCLVKKSRANGGGEEKCRDGAQNRRAK